MRRIIRASVEPMKRQPSAQRAATPHDLIAQPFQGTFEDGVSLRRISTVHPPAESICPIEDIAADLLLLRHTRADDVTDEYRRGVQDLLFRACV